MREKVVSIIPKLKEKWYLQGIDGQYDLTTVGNFEHVYDRVAEKKYSGRNNGDSIEWSTCVTDKDGKNKPVPVTDEVSVGLLNDVVLHKKKMQKEKVLIFPQSQRNNLIPFPQLPR